METFHGQAIQLKSTIDYYKMDRRQISFVKFILEAYDNMAVLTTLDAREAIVKLTIAPGCETIVRDILTDFNQVFEIAPLDYPTLQATPKDGCMDGTKGSESLG